MQIRKNILFSIAAIPVILLGIYLITLVYLYFNQEKLIFHSSSLPAEHQFTFDLPFEEISIPVEGAQLNALHFKQENPRGLFFFLHGNSGNLETWTSGVDFYQKVNYDLFIFDYRGYGKSTGHIESQAQLHADVMAAWNSIASQYEGKPIVIYGRSLGTGLAVELASQVDADLLALASPYSNLSAIARKRYPLIPPQVLRYPLATDEIIADIKTPTIFLHGVEDKVIPISHSEYLQSLMTHKSTLFAIQDANHQNIHESDVYLNSLANALP